MKKNLLLLATMALTVASAWADVTINVDDASKVKVMDATYSYLELQNGANTVAADDYMIQPATYDYAINKVVLNGEEKPVTYGYWSLSLVDGDVLDITALYDAETYTVTINAPAGVIKSVSSANNDIENYGEPFESPAGYALIITPNTVDYNILSVKVNGVDINYYSGSFSVSIKGATTIDITAEEKSTMQFTINATDPEAVAIFGAQYSTYYDSNCPIVLTGEQNTVSLPEEYSYIAIVRRSGYLLTSVSVDGVSYTDSWGVYYVPVANGCVVDIVCGEIVKDQNATVVVKDMSAANYGFAFMNVDFEAIMVEEGVNTINFATSYNPFAWGCYGSAVAPVVYVNGEQKDPAYEGGTYFNFEILDGDYVELFVLGGESEYWTVGLSKVAEAAQSTIYDLNGQRVNAAVKGIYVIDGRKVMVK